MRNRPTIRLVLEAFYVNAILANAAVCGGFDGDEQFEATVELEVEELDVNGFVVDNHGFIEYVDEQFSKTMLKASCEELAMGLVNLAHRKTDDRLVACRATVTNRTGYAEIKWEKGQSVPNFPRVATRAEREATNGKEKLPSC